MIISETFADKVASPQAQARMFLEEDDEDNKVCVHCTFNVLKLIDIFNFLTGLQLSISYTI